MENRYDLDVYDYNMNFIAQYKNLTFDKLVDELNFVKRSHFWTINVVYNQHRMKRAYHFFNGTLIHIGVPKKKNWF